MKNSVLEILEKLVSFKTITGKNSEEFTKCWEYIDEKITQVENWGFREYVSNGFKSRVYSDQKHIDADEKYFDLYLYANIDVVDAKDYLFSVFQTGDTLIGRGVVDMKFALAVALFVLMNLDKEFTNKRIALIVTTDEEFGGMDGVKYLVDEIGFRGKVLIGPNGKLDSEKFNFEVKNKGTIHTKYTVYGKAAHGSRTWEGENAIEKAFQMFRELKTRFHVGDKDNWGSTVNLGKLEGGFATNAVPDKATMQIDFRYVDKMNADEYYSFEEKLLEKYSAEAELIVDAMNIDVDQNNEIFKKYKKIAEEVVGKEKINLMKSYGSHDVREFFRVGILPILFMPRGGDNHMDSEWLKIEDLEKLIEINERFIKEIL